NRLLRTSDRAAEAAAPPAGPAQPTAAEQLETVRGQARAARDAERWDDAYTACRDGLRLAPSDVELTTICAHAACVAGNAEAAGLYLRRVPPADRDLVRKRCRDAGVADSLDR
ncbi:MAG TPA: hypothetical protein VHE35_30300, partial [Kofleriaceae bacterium]|nr:hypothetical protein [Kofleriaceae bacterium]